MDQCWEASQGLGLLFLPLEWKVNCFEASSAFVADKLVLLVQWAEEVVILGDAEFLASVACFVFWVHEGAGGEFE